MKVILISGHAQNGKDTTASIIEHQLKMNGKKVLICHYGDLVKYVCTAFFGWDGMKDIKGRTLLQHVGTDVIRKQDPDYWVRFIAEMLTFFNDTWDYVLIPDVRFPNEINYIADRFDCVHIRVNRPNFKSPLTKEQQMHPSETALDNSKPDVMLLNDESIFELKEKVKNIISEVL